MDMADFEQFADVASAISSEARADFERFWERLDFSDIAAAREAIIEYVTALVETYGNAASLNAAQFFEETSGVANARTVNAVRAERIKSVVRYSMKLVLTGMLEDALSTILADMDLQIKGAGRDTMIENARRSKKKFARVPRGSSTCEFCIMLASRGFVYHTKETAGDLNRFHPHCDCQIVAGFPGDRLEGYDPDKLYERYRDCRKTCGSGDENSILSEMRTRDRAWLNTGAVPEPSYLKPREAFDGADDERDLFAHDALSKHGFAVTVLQEDAPEGYSNIDLMINGQKWEVKSPTSGNIRTVEDNLRKANRQFLKDYPKPTETVRVVFNGKNVGVDDFSISTEIKRRMKQHRIDEVIQIMKDGSIKRFTA